MRGNVKIHQKKLAARRRRRAFLLTLYSMAAAGLLLCALSYISGLESLSIQGTSVSGNNRLSSSTVEAIALKDMAGNYLGFFSKQNLLLYPSRAIRADLRALPLVKDVHVSRTRFRTLSIDVAERSKVARWCTGNPGDASDCYSVDGNSLIFAKETCASVGYCAPAAGSPAARATGAAAVFLGAGAIVSAPPASSSSTGDSSGFIYRGLVTGDPVGQTLLDPAEFRKISFFVGELAGLSVDPREAILSGTSTSPYMTVILGGGGKLVINTADDLSVVLGNISAVISNKTVAPSLAKFLSQLDYMKLDIGSKVVYKLRGK